jgi:hypothetical protein
MCLCAWVGGAAGCGYGWDVGSELCANKGPQVAQVGGSVWQGEILGWRQLTRQASGLRLRWPGRNLSKFNSKWASDGEGGKKPGKGQGRGGDGAHEHRPRGSMGND